jgi:hypothetical protein
MMRLTGAQGTIATVDARVNRERPRPEIQPIGKCQGRQRQVLAVQRHGETLTSAAERAGSRGEATAFMSVMLGCGVTGLGTISASLDQVPSHGVRSGSRDFDATGQHTRSFQSPARFTNATDGDGDGETEKKESRSNRHPSGSTAIDILSWIRVRAKSEKLGFSRQLPHTPAGDSHVFSLVDNVEPLI